MARHATRISVSQLSVFVPVLAAVCRVDTSKQQEPFWDVASSASLAERGIKHGMQTFPVATMDAVLFWWCI